MLYAIYDKYAYIHIYMQNTYWRNNKDDEWHSLLEKYTSHFIWKGLCVWEGVGDRTEVKHIDPHSCGHQRCVFLVLQGCSTGGLGAQLSAGCWLSLPHLVTKLSDLQTNWLPVFTELYNSSIAHSISLEWHVWSSSSGNNCHAVHLFRCISLWLYHGILPCPILSAKPADAISSHNCHWNVSLPSGASLWNGMFGRVEGQYTTYTDQI